MCFTFEILPQHGTFTKVRCIKQFDDRLVLPTETVSDIWNELDYMVKWRALFMGQFKWAVYRVRY